MDINLKRKAMKRRVSCLDLVQRAPEAEKEQELTAEDGLGAFAPNRLELQDCDGCARYSAGV